MQSPKKLPNHNSGTHGYIQRMLGSVLRYFNAHITLIDNGLLNTFYLVSKNDGILFCLV